MWYHPLASFVVGNHSASQLNPEDAPPAGAGGLPEGLGGSRRLPCLEISSETLGWSAYNARSRPESCTEYLGYMDSGALLCSSIRSQGRRS